MMKTKNHEFIVTVKSLWNVAFVVLASILYPDRSGSSPCVTLASSISQNAPPPIFQLERLAKLNLNYTHPSIFISKRVYGPGFVDFSRLVFQAVNTTSASSVNASENTTSDANVPLLEVIVQRTSAFQWNGQDSFCCNNETLATGACINPFLRNSFNRDRFINDDLYYHLILPLTGGLATSIDAYYPKWLIADDSADGVEYALLVAYCADPGTAATTPVTAQGDVFWKSKYGFRPGSLTPFIWLYSFLGLAYVILWMIWAVLYWVRISPELRVVTDRWMGLALAWGLVQMFLTMGQYISWQRTGYNHIALSASAQAMEIFQVGLLLVMLFVWATGRPPRWGLCHPLGIMGPWFIISWQVLNIMQSYYDANMETVSFTAQQTLLAFTLLMTFILWTITVVWIPWIGIAMFRTWRRLRRRFLLQQEKLPDTDENHDDDASPTIPAPLVRRYMWFNIIYILGALGGFTFLMLQYLYNGGGELIMIAGQQATHLFVSAALLLVGGPSRHGPVWAHPVDQYLMPPSTVNYQDAADQNGKTDDHHNVNNDDNEPMEDGDQAQDVSEFKDEGVVHQEEERVAL